MDLLERGDWIAEMMMYKRTRRAVEARGRERNRLGARVQPCDSGALALRRLEHERRNFETVNVNVRVMHRESVVAGAGTDIEVSAGGTRAQVMNQTPAQGRIGLPSVVVTRADSIVERHPIRFARHRRSR